MKMESDPVKLYTENIDAYLRHIRFARYPLGIRAYLLHSSLLGSDLRVLDAGCGTGVVTLALREAVFTRKFRFGALDGFDLTPAMLERFAQTLEARDIENVRLFKANVLDLKTLPRYCHEYSLIVSAGMLEYVPREKLADALRGLRSRLAGDGTLLLFITRKNPITKLLIRRWWQGNLYTRSELEADFRGAGFTETSFKRFPLLFSYLNLWGHIVEARR